MKNFQKKGKLSKVALKETEKKSYLQKKGSILVIEKALPKKSPEQMFSLVDPKLIFKEQLTPVIHKLKNKRDP